MFKTVKSKMIFMQTIMLLLTMAIIFIIFIAFSENYYFEKKMDVIKEAYEEVEDINIADLKPGSLYSYEEQRLAFVISDENFEPIYVTGRNRRPDRAKAEVDKRIRRRVEANRFAEEYSEKNGKNKVRGEGIITQNGHKYYVYIYEKKTAINIYYYYYKTFFLVTVLLAIVTGIIVSIIISNKISRPIKKIEKASRIAVDNGFNEINIDIDSDFEELTSLSNSINMMMEHIAKQMKALEREIESKTLIEERRKYFVNNVSHEMKTPLAIISSQVEMLVLIEDEQKRKEYCESIVEETTKMSELINSMVLIYNAQNDRETMALEEINISDIVENTCYKNRALFLKNNIHLELEKEDKCIGIGNESYLTQAVDNYITNSIKHSDSNSTVFVRTYNKENYVRIEVENQGPHIAQENKDKIWDMFYRGDADDNLNGQRGSGLGLNIVKGIVKLHNGKYGFDNLEKGVVFWMEIPKSIESQQL